MFAADFFFKQTCRLSSRSIVVYSYRVILIVSKAFCCCQIKRCHKFARLLRFFRLDQAVSTQKAGINRSKYLKRFSFSLKSTLTTSFLEVKGKKSPHSKDQDDFHKTIFPLAINIWRAGLWCEILIYLLFCFKTAYTIHSFHK